MTTDTKTVKAVASAIENGTLKLTFSHGKTLAIDATMLNPELLAYAALHGLKQKLVDAAAILRNPDTGASATIDDKYDAVREIYDRITSPDGTWNKVRGDGTGGGASVGLLVRALMAMTGKNEDDTRAQLDACTDDEVKALRGNPKVAAKIAEFKNAASKIDTGALLAKFGA